MAETTSLTLAEVEAAIRKVLLTGSAYNRTGLSFTRADLGELRSLRRELMAEQRAGSETGSTFVPDFNTGSGSGTEADEWGDA